MSEVKTLVVARQTMNPPAAGVDDQGPAVGGGRRLRRLFDQRHRAGDSRERNWDVDDTMSNITL